MIVADSEVSVTRVFTRRQQYLVKAGTTYHPQRHIQPIIANALTRHLARVCPGTFLFAPHRTRRMGCWEPSCACVLLISTSIYKMAEATDNTTSAALQVA